MKKDQEERWILSHCELLVELSFDSERKVLKVEECIVMVVMLRMVPMIPTIPIIDNIYTLVFLTGKGWQKNSIQFIMKPVLVHLV